MTLPDIPRLYTALAEWLACTLYLVSLRPRLGRLSTVLLSACWLVVLGGFLQITGSVPLTWWIPCMAAAVAGMFLYIFTCCDVSARDAGYCCARAFLMAEFAASLEWQLHCTLWPQFSGWQPLPLLLLVVVYAAVFGIFYWFEFRRLKQNPTLGITGRARARKP